MPTMPGLAAALATGLVGADVLGGEQGTHGAALPEMLGQRAGVDPLDADDPVGGEVVGEADLAAPVARRLAEFFDDEAADVGLVGFGIELVDPVVADQRVGHGDDLAAVGGIGEHLLVAGHRGVEADLTEA